MSLATTLMAVGIPAEQANRLGYEDRVPLDGNGTTQAGATEIIATNTNVALGTSAGDTAFILPAEAELFQPYFLLNTTAEPALIFPPVGDTIDAEALNDPVSAPLDTARIIWRVEEGRWVSLSTGVAQEAGIVASVVAGTGISVDSTDPANPVVSNTGVLSVTADTGISVGGTAQNPTIANSGVLSVSAGTNVSITGTAQNPIVNAASAPVSSVNGQTGAVSLDAGDVGAIATIVAGTNITVDATDPQNPIVSASGGGTGTVTAVAVASANGLAGTSDGNPATPTLTLRTTVTGILQGNGTSISAASTTGTGAIVLAQSPTIVTPTVAGTDGAQAPLTASLTDTTSVVASPAKMWNPTYFGNPGTAVVHKFNRVMVGEATVGSTDLPMSTPDWLETLVPSTTQYGQLASVSATGNLGVLGASRTSDFRTWAGSASGGSQGVTGFGWNDDTGAGNPIAVGAEFRGFRATSVTGITVGAQISAANEGTTVDITPSGGVVGGSTMALLLTNGPAPTDYDNPISAAMVVGSGALSAVSRKGVVFLDDALDVSLGAGGGGIAVEMARAQSARWLNSGDTADGEIWADASGLALAAPARIGANLANYYTLTGSASTQPVLSVDGSSADIDVMIQAKGLGTVIARRTDAATTSVSIAAQLRHSLSSGTAGAGIGVGQNFVIVNASSVNKIVGIQEAVTTDATNGSEDADFVWRLMAAGAAAAEKFRIKSTGAPIFRPPVTPETLAVNGEVTLSLTSNTNLRISARGSDGTTRVANITLA